MSLLDSDNFKVYIQSFSFDAFLMISELLSVLPSFIYIKGEEGTSVPWLETTLNFIYTEADASRPGAQTIITRLADILFIQVIRQHIDSSQNNCQGWLTGLKDPQIGKALEKAE